MAETTITILKETETGEEVQTELDGMVAIADDGEQTAFRVDSSGNVHTTKGTDPEKQLAVTGGGLDTTAIHVDEANEITGIAEKTVVVDADLLIMEDSEASNVKKKVQMSNIPLGDIDGGSPSDTYLTSQIIDGGTP